MPTLTDGDAEKRKIHADEAVHAPSYVTWPFGGSREEKMATLALIQDRPPSEEQAAELQRGLAVEEDGEISNGLMRCVLQSQGLGKQDADGPYLKSSDVMRVYEQALAEEQAVHVRIALHQGFARFLPRGLGDGLMSAEHSRLLATRLDDCQSPYEVGAIVDLLRRRGRFTPSEWLDLANKWLDDPKRPPSASQVTLWTQAVEKAVGERLWYEGPIRKEAGALLCRLLARVEDPKVIGCCLRLLASGKYGELPALPDQLRQRIAHDDWSVVDESAKLASKLGDAGVRLLKEMVSTSPRPHTVSCSWSALRDLGLDPGALISLAAQNPNVDATARTILGYDGRHWSALTLAWPSLLPALRDALERRWRTDADEHGTPDSLREWFYALHRAHDDSPLAAAALSWVTRPLRDVLGACDFEAVSGLRREDSVEFRAIKLLRFAYLAVARDRRGMPLADRLRRSDVNLEQLIAEEAQYDRARDELAQVRRRLDEVAARLGSEVLAEVRRAAGREDEPNARRLRDRFVDEDEAIANLVQEFERLSRDVDLHADNGRFYRLFHASDRLLPMLRDAGCSFAGIRGPDGILGEYQPVDRSVTLFTPMIDLAAVEVADHLGRPQDEVAPLVRTVVEVHELAHAHLHLGRDARGSIWETSGEGSVAHHEAVAQCYTRRLVSGMEVEGLRDVLAVLEGWLPPEYRFADLLSPIDSEDLRAWVVTSRRSRPVAELEGVVLTVSQALPGYLRLLASQMPGGMFRVITEELDTALAHLEYRQWSDAAVDLLSTIARLPHVPSLLGPFLPGGWPTPAQLRWLHFEARIAGPSVGDRPLRFLTDRDHASGASTRPVAQAGELPSLRACESTLTMLRAEAERMAAGEGRFGGEHGSAGRARPKQRRRK